MKKKLILFLAGSAMALSVQVSALAQGVVPNSASEAVLLKISNNQKLSFVQRRTAAVSLCRGYVRGGMSLRDFGKLMQKTNWLTRDSMQVVKAVAGFLPFEWDGGESVLLFDLVSEKGVELPALMYLKVNGSHSDKSLEQWIFDGAHSDANAPLILNAVVCDFTSGPGPRMIDPQHTLHVTSDQVF
jgi:hypothetical protein